MAGAALRALAFLRRHAAPDAAAGARLAAQAHTLPGSGAGLGVGSGRYPTGVALPFALAEALETAPRLMDAVTASADAHAAACGTAIGHATAAAERHAYGVASALVAAAQVRAAAVLAGVEGGEQGLEQGAEQGETAVCREEDFERFWPALELAAAGRSAISHSMSVMTWLNTVHCGGSRSCLTGELAAPAKKDP